MKRDISHQRAKCLANEIFVNDRFYAKGHVVACKTSYLQKIYRELDGVNTMICEQRNFWSNL